MSEVGERRPGTSRSAYNESRTVRVLPRDSGGREADRRDGFWCAAADVPPTVRPHTVGDAAEAAGLLRNDDAVLLDLGELEEAGQRRVLDFIAGVVYGVGARMTRLDGDGPMFLLSPTRPTDAIDGFWPDDRKRARSRNRSRSAP